MSSIYQSKNLININNKKYIYSWVPCPDDEHLDDLLKKFMCFWIWQVVQTHCTVVHIHQFSEHHHTQIFRKDFWEIWRVLDLAKCRFGQKKTFTVDQVKSSEEIQTKPEAVSELL